MDEKTRQLVLDMLARAHEGALKSVQARLRRLPEGDREVVDRSIAEFRECMLQTLENVVLPDESLERIAALIHGHPSPQVVRILRDYAEAVNYLLIESRSGLKSPEKHKDN